MKKFIHPALYILSLIACCIEVDISVPSFPDLVLHFHTTESLAQHTVSINFLGFFISALIIGPLSDAYGRRPIMIAAYLSFITCAPFLYMQSFELPMYLYALHQALIVTAFACTSLFSGMILKYIGPSKCICLGLSLCILGTCLFLLASLICPSAALTTAFVSVFAVGFALFYPVVFTASLEVFSNLKGSATSIIMAKRALIIAFFTWTIGCVYNGSPVSISVLMVVISSITFALSYKKNIIFNFL